MRLVFGLYVFLHAMALGSTAGNYDPDTDTTEPNDDGLEEGELIQLWPVGDDDVAMDLCDRRTVRYQAHENLSLVAAREFIVAVLAHPILCIGTGRDKDVMQFFHARRTIIRDDDISIDISPRLNPHYVCDAFQIFDLNEIYGDQTFGTVFFAHVSNPIFAFKEPQLESTCRRYFRALIKGGFLIFNSEVYASCDHMLAQADTDLASIRYSWRQLLEPIGFVAIEIIKKDETAYFGVPASSLLLVAQRPR